MKFNNIDLSQFVKTKLAQEIQKSQIGNFIKKKGAPPITSTVKISKLGDKPKTAEGIDMGQQVEPGVIPIIYGHVGMSNTQFDLGQKPSDVDAAFVTQEVKLPVSEGPIFGLAYRSAGSGSSVRDPDGQNHIYSMVGDTAEHFKQIIINDSFVVEPTTSVANFKDIKFELTRGDGAGVYQSGTIRDYNPLLVEEDDNVKIEALNDSTNQKLLNDLGDVQAGKGVNYVLYWNQEAGRWEAKSFNELLNSVGATYDGGAGGSGGSGGSGGQGGVGGQGGIGPGTGLIKYTQWNPPPAHTKGTGKFEYEHTVTEPVRPAQTVDTDKGAPLFRVDETTPIFTTDIDFADVDESVDNIAINIHFPDGIYKEIKTTITTKDGNIELCGTERPITNSGNLNCLTPVIAVAEDGKSSTTKTRVTGEIQVYYALTTVLCEGTPDQREFILHDSTFNISELSNEPYTHRHEVALAEMNAGSTHIGYGTNRGDSHTGPLDGVEETATCDPNKPQQYDYQTWTLADYLAAYPNDIVSAARTVKVYAWILDRLDHSLDNILYEDQYSISTNAYLKAVDVCKPMNDYEHWYAKGGLISTNYALYGPNHNWNWKGRTRSTYSDDYYLKNERCYDDVVSGSWGDDLSPEPLIIEDGITAGASGTTGTVGSTGSTGVTGSPGTSGTVNVPTVPDVPNVEMAKDSSYSGDGVADTVTLPKVTVTNPDATATNDLTIRVDKGTIDVTSLTSGVTAIGRNTSAITLTGTASNLQSCVDTGLKFYSTTATKGDVTITLYISSNEGNSETTKTIRSEAITEYSAPQFTITINGTTGVLEVQIDGKSIMSALVASGTTTEIAEDCAQYINNASTTPNWTATSSGNVVTVTGPDGLGASYNGKQPVNNAVPPQMDVTISPIGAGVSPSRQTQPKRDTKALKGKFIPALAFTNSLDANEVAFAQIKYRPAQGDGESSLSEIGLFVGGRDEIQEPGSGNAMSFEDWYDAGYISTPGWSNNPAWVFFDYLTNTRFGLGNDIILNEDQKLDLYSDIYNAGLWCDLNPTNVSQQTVARFNGIFYGAESKFEALQKIADTMFAKFVYLNGNPRLIFDGWAHPWPNGAYTPVVKKLVNQSNATDFLYQSGDIDNIYNVINVKWNNPENFFRLEEVQYKNQSSISKFGERETSIELLGCTSKQQALWHGAWMYETEAANSETVTYIAGWDHYDVLPGDLIHLNDTLRPDAQTVGGRVVSDNGDGTVTLDRDAGTGSIAIVDSFGNIKTGTVNGTTATISTSETKTVNTTSGEITYYADFADDAVWNKYSGDLEPNYRVIAIEESEDGIYSVTAQKHDPDKYTRIWANTV